MPIARPSPANTPRIRPTVINLTLPFGSGEEGRKSLLLLLDDGQTAKKRYGRTCHFFRHGTTLLRTLMQMRPVGRIFARIILLGLETVWSHEPSERVERL